MPGGSNLPGIYIYFQITFPRVDPAENITVQSTPEIIERGEYLAKHVTLCIDCHSRRDWQYFGGPLVHGTEGQGGEPFTKSMGFPGDIYAKNITPVGIGNWTDGEVIRAMNITPDPTTGIGLWTKEIFIAKFKSYAPRESTKQVVFEDGVNTIMPWSMYAGMTEEDLGAIFEYLQTVQPIENQVTRYTLAE